jgi:hypothetical protein
MLIDKKLTYSMKSAWKGGLLFLSDTEQQRYLRVRLIIHPSFRSKEK